MDANGRSNRRGRGSVAAAQPTPDPGVVSVHGAVTSDEVSYARERLAGLARYSRRPVLSTRTRLTRMPDPAMKRTAIAHVSLSLNGQLILAEAARPTMREAIDEVHDRLRDQLLRITGTWEAARRAGSPRINPPRRPEEPTADEPAGDLRFR